MKYQNRRRKRALWILCILVVLAAYVSWTLLRPLPLLASMGPSSFELSTPTTTLPWPGYGQSALGLVGNDLVSANGVQKPLPIASTAKVITAMAVLQKKPLKLGERGPNITLGARDIDLYNKYAAQDGSLVPVNSGEVISEYQALQTVLLPSANNMADSLAIWAFGSMDNYLAYANKYVKQLTMLNTSVRVDASGFSPATTSTAEDLVHLGKAAMQNPVVAQIVGQSTANNIPVVGTITNVNALLGYGGIVGIKTGNTEEAGGVFLGAAQANVSGKTVVVVTAIMGAPNLYTALHDSKPLLAAAQANFANVAVLRKGAVVGRYSQPWGGSVPIIVTDTLEITAWRGTTINAQANTVSALSSTTDVGQIVGSVSIAKGYIGGAKSTNLVLGDAPTSPSVWWRLTTPYNN